MTDLIYIGITGLFFVVGGLYVGLVKGDGRGYLSFYDSEHCVMQVDKRGAYLG